MLRGITYGMLAAGTLILAVGCATLGFAPEDQKETLYKAYAVYVKTYQPILKGYDRLAYCGSPAVSPCKDKGLYKKLYVLDGAILACGITAKKAIWHEADYAAVEPCLQQIGEAQTALKGISR